MSSAQPPEQPPEQPPSGGAAVPPPPPPPPPPGYAPPPPGYAPGYPQPTPPVYAQPYPPAYPPVARTSGRATAVMVLGIVGLVIWCGYGVGVIPAIVALALAPGAKREIAASGGMLTGEGMVKAGVICAWVTVGLTVLAVVALAALLFIGAATSSTIETPDPVRSAVGTGALVVALPQWRRLHLLPREN